MAPLRTYSGGPAVCVLHPAAGSHGTGSTQAAAAFARQCVADRWRFVAWISAETTSSVLMGISGALTALAEAPPAISGTATSGIQAAVFDQALAAATLRSWLEAGGQQCLVVFDNAPDPGALVSYLPAAGHAHVIITSARRPLDGPGFSVSVDGFSPVAAVCYLARRTGLADAVGAEELAAELGYLPLALAQATGVISAQQLSYASYLAQLRAVRVPPHLVESAQEGTCRRAAMAAVLLAVAEHAGLAGRILELAALLAPAGVPVSLVHTAAAAGALMPRPAGVSAPGAVSRADVDQAVEELAGAALLTVSADGSAVTVHRLTSRAVRGGLNGQRSLAAAITVLHHLTQQAGPLWRDPIAVQDLIGQITALHQNAAGAGPNVAVRLLELRLWALRSARELRVGAHQVIPAGQQVVADCERLLGPGYPQTLEARNGLADSYGSAGRFADAVAVRQQALADQELRYGPHHPGRLDLQLALASDYEDTLRLDEAISLVRDILAEQDQIVGASHPSVQETRAFLSRLCHQAGQFDEAVALQKQALADAERDQGPGAAGTLAARLSLADLLRQTGRLDESIELSERILAGREQSVGADHRDTLHASTCLARYYQEAGRFGEAFALFERALAGYERLFGATDRSTSSYRATLSCDYWAAGRFGEAIAHYESAVAGFEHTLGAAHSDTLDYRRGLAFLYQQAGQADAALALLQRNLAIQERGLGPSHPATEATRISISRVRQETG